MRLEYSCVVCLFIAQEKPRRPGTCDTHKIVAALFLYSVNAGETIGDDSSSHPYPVEHDIDIMRCGVMLLERMSARLMDKIRNYVQSDCTAACYERRQRCVGMQRPDL